MSSGRTTRAQVPYPLTSDAANVATDIAAIANFIDLNVPLWATTSGSAPTPSVNSTGGELWWCTQAGSNSLAPIQTQRSIRRLTLKTSFLPTRPLPALCKSRAAL